MTKELSWPPIAFDTGVRHESDQQKIIRDAYLDELDPFDIIRVSYPRVYARISILWGTQELADQLKRWMFTDQRGRKGFPPDVAMALLKISIEHQEKFGLIGSDVERPFPDRW